MKKPIVDKASIIVVDDNEEFCDNIKDILEIEGFSVLIAYDGFTAIPLVEHVRPHVVLLDVRLPGMDGVATFQRIRKLIPDLPVVIMTAQSMEERVKEALREGAFGSVRKPLDIERLLSIIKNARKTHILVVDDDRDLCANLEDALTEKGYSVTVAYDGSRAVDRVWEYDFDLILLDMKLPARNGLETYRAIRDVRPYACVVMITGYPQEMGWLAQQAVQEHAFTWLEKPLNLLTLDSILERKKSRDQTIQGNAQNRGVLL